MSFATMNNRGVSNTELEEIRAAFAELKESSASLEEDLENEIRQLEQEGLKKDQKILQLEHTLETNTKKIEQAREYTTRHQLSLEKQVHAYEASNKRLREDCRRLEQRTETAENTCRVLQSQYEELGDHLESVLSKEAMLELEMEDIETRLKVDFENETIKTKNEYEAQTIKLENELKSVSLQLAKLSSSGNGSSSSSHSSASQKLSLDPGDAAVSPRSSSFPRSSDSARSSSSPRASSSSVSRSSLDDKHNEVKQAALLFLNKQLREQLATVHAELEQTKKRLSELETGIQLPQSPTASTITTTTTTTTTTATTTTVTATAAPTITRVPSVGSGALPEVKSFDGMEGYLYKRGEGAVVTWKRLLFKINSDLHALEFFFVQISKNTTVRTKLGEISLSGASISESKSDNTIFHIQPRFSKKTYILQATSVEERAKWLETLARHVAKKLVAGSICEDWLKVGTEEDNCQSMYCALFKDSFQYYADPKDLRPLNHLQLVDIILVERTSERPILGLDYGPGIETERYFVDCGSDEKHAIWISEFFQLLGRKRSETSRHQRDSVVTRSPSVLGGAGMGGGENQGELQGKLCQLNSHTQKWDEFFFVLSRHDSLLKTFSVVSQGQGEPLSVLPLLQTQQTGANIAAIITNYPVGVFANREHLFGITPPYSNLTCVFQARTEADMLQWLDGLVSFLDSKVLRDPYSTEEGYLYKQKQHKRTVDYKKKYVILSLPTLKYYKSGTTTSGGKTMFLNPESQVILQAPPRKYVFAFSVRETAESKEVLWTCKNHAEGEKWVAAIQAAIVKLRSSARPSAIVTTLPPDFLGLTKVNVRTSVHQYNQNQPETFVLKPKEQRVAARSSRLRSSSAGPGSARDPSAPVALKPSVTTPTSAIPRRKWW